MSKAFKLDVAHFMAPMTKKSGYARADRLLLPRRRLVVWTRFSSALRETVVFDGAETLDAASLLPLAFKAATMMTSKENNRLAVDDGMARKFGRQQTHV